MVWTCHQARARKQQHLNIAENVAGELFFLGVTAAFHERKTTKAGDAEAGTTIATTT
jgi:hypothetical protein